LQRLAVKRGGLFLFGRRVEELGEASKIWAGRRKTIQAAVNFDASHSLQRLAVKRGGPFLFWAAR